MGELQLRNAKRLQVQQHAYVFKLSIFPVGLRRCTRVKPTLRQLKTS